MADLITLMELPEEKLAEMLAYEAFIRRAAQLNRPFMLKGSYVTRQYYRDPANRVPADLDWVCLETLNDAGQAELVFNEWATAVTETVADDGVTYTSFREDAFWRRIDYAMADDFPTVNTYISCRVEGQMLRSLDLDISFNLDMEAPPVPLLYKPLRGEPFVIPFTAPLSLQVSWKMHQTLVRPRFKDLLDLTELLRHPSWNSETLQQSVQALVNECAADNIDPRRLGLLLSGDLASLFPDNTLQKTWDYWRHDAYSRNRVLIPYDDTGKALTDVSLLPEQLSGFVRQLTDAFAASGWNQTLVGHLPSPTTHKRKGYYRAHDTEDTDSSNYIPEQGTGDIIQPPSPKVSGIRAFWRFWYGLFK